MRKKTIITTHSKEKDLLEAAGYDATSLVDEDWYRKAGAVKGKNLQITEEYNAQKLNTNTLPDTGTYLNF